MLSLCQISHITGQVIPTSYERPLGDERPLGLEVSALLFGAGVSGLALAAAAFAWELLRMRLAKKKKKGERAAAIEVIPMENR